MNGPNINKTSNRVKVLVAPLDWGLGHATRCIPIIRVLSRQKVELVIAAHGPTRKLLEAEFPALQFIELTGYQITYSKNKWSLPFKLISQLPKLFLRVNREKKILQKIIRSEKIDAVISDNRPGLHNKNIPCIYITHQLHIQTGNKFLNKFVQKLHYSFIDQFNECWVPDLKSENNLAGQLSHPNKLPQSPVKYLGVLSRFKKRAIEEKFDFLLLVSGPEPQRTIFEKSLLNVFGNSEFSFVLLRGLPHENGNELKVNNGIIINHLETDEFETLLHQCKTVISRSGYSTIMDLVTINKTAILIPTPGQTEQEYLAKYLKQKSIFNYISQGEISMKAIRACLQEKTILFSNETTLLDEKVIIDWLRSIHPQVLQ